MGQVCLDGPKVVLNGPSVPKWAQVNLNEPKVVPNEPRVPKWAEVT